MQGGPESSPPQQAGPEHSAKVCADSDRESVPKRYGRQRIIYARERAGRSAQAAGDKASSCACARSIGRCRCSSVAGTTIKPTAPAIPANHPIVKGFFEKRTSSAQYVVADPETKRCAIIDPVLDFDPSSGATATHSADELLQHIEHRGYELEWILDMHPHADHFLAAGYLNEKTGVPTAIGEKVIEVQKLWQGIYNIADCSPADTLASIAYVMGDAAFIHDTIFMPDGGTARTDFPGGSARALWKSIQRILGLLTTPACLLGMTIAPLAESAPLR